MARRKTRLRWRLSVCERYGARHVVRHLSQQEFVEDLPAILEAMDQPSIDGVNTWFVSKAAKEAGLKVAISGLGGDELLGGLSELRGRTALAASVRPTRRRAGARAFCAHSSSVAVAPGFFARATQGAWASGTFGYLGWRLSSAPRLVPAARVAGGHGPRNRTRGYASAKAIASSRREPQARSRVPTSRASACLSRRTTCAISFYGTPTGRGWRTALRFACRSWTSRCSARSHPVIPALTQGAGKAALAKAPDHAVAKRDRDPSEDRFRCAHWRLDECGCW